MHDSDLIYDWNVAGPRQVPAALSVELDDETLRDGLQSPSVTAPSIADKIRILHLQAALGIHASNIGLPGAGLQATRDVMALAREIADARLTISPNCAARTLSVDIDPIVEASEVAGIPIEAAVFIGSSPIRQFAEDWEIERMLRHTSEAVEYAVRHGLPVMYVTEDTTRAQPETLKALYSAAIRAGAQRICIADTVGHATPEGVWNLVHFIRMCIADVNPGVKLDWHGHNDRGLGLINTLTAIYAGVDRVHGTALGIGERVGNTSMDQLLVNFRLLGWLDNDLRELGAYCDLVSRVTRVGIPANYPVFGDDAFRTATGVHAAAVIKALRKGNEWLANRVYSSVPAEQFGRAQCIEVGPMSGQSNVIYWLEVNGFEPAPDLVDVIFSSCKQADCVLTSDQIRIIVADWQHQTVGA